MQDDLASSAFLKLLQRRHSDLYRRAELKCYPILVPQGGSLVGVKLEKEVFALHILKPSPYFASHYMTLDGSEKTVEMKSNTIVTKNGFAEKRTINILDEELYYNEDNSSRKVLFIDRPLVGGVVVQSHTNLPTERTYEACKSFLRSFPENEIVINKIDELIEQFNRTYLFIKGFETDAAKKQETIFEFAVDSLICANPFFRKLHDQDLNLVELNEIIEIYVTSGTHKKLWGTLCDNFATLDDAIFGLVNPLNDIRQEDLEIRAELRTPMVEAVRRFRKMTDVKSPLAKLYCLQETNNSIMNAIEQKASKTVGGDYSVTTDDLIPFLVYIIILAKPKHLYTDVFLMENFTCTSVSVSQLGFNLVSLQAAIQYLKGPKFEQVRKKWGGKSATPVESSVETKNKGYANNESTTYRDPYALSKDALTPGSFSIDAPSAAATSSIVTELSPRRRKKNSCSSRKNPFRDDLINLVDDKQKPPEVSSNSKWKNYKTPPAVISISGDKDEKLGSFLSSLKNKGDSSSLWGS